MVFEKFDRVAAAAATRPPQVIVLANGDISLTWRAFEMLGSPGYVEFYFDKDAGLVGIAPTEDKSNGYQVRLPRASGKAPGETKGKVSIRGAIFFKYYEIEPHAKYDRTPEFVDGMLTFEIEQAPSQTQQVSAPAVAEFLEREEPPF